MTEIQQSINHMDAKAVRRLLQIVHSIEGGEVRPVICFHHRSMLIIIFHHNSNSFPLIGASLKKAH